MTVELALHPGLGIFALPGVQIHIGLPQLGALEQTRPAMGLADCSRRIEQIDPETAEITPLEEKSNGLS